MSGQIYNFRINPEFLALLAQVASRTGLSRAQALRASLRYCAEHGVDLQPDDFLKERRGWNRRDKV
jgi:antitoxin component of RelBE/YafQ-DinJ toxin-antitoxin module